MNLKFINTLTDEQWIALINFSMQQHCKKKQMNLPRKVTWVNRHQEADRKDKNGNQYILLETGDGIHILDTYRANDFGLCTQNAGFYGEYPPIILDQELRIFLTIYFKNEYLKALAHYLQSQMDQELAMLAEFTTFAKEK